jgi:hypothetical protein
LTGYANKAISWGNPGAGRDINPQILLEKLDQTLTPRFKRVVQVADMTEAGRARCDLIMIYDAQVRMGSISGQINTVEVSGIFLDAAEQVIEKVTGQGTSRIPYPAFTLKLGKAADEAFSEFARNLDSAGKLATFVAAHRTNPTSMASVMPPSNPTSAKLEPSRPTPGPAFAPVANRWAVIVGISKYEFSAPGGMSDLAFAERDAQDFAKTLENLGWGTDHMVLLTNEKATKRGVETALEIWLRRAGPNDQIILFWSSHGWPDLEDPEKASFACYDSKTSDLSSGMRMDRVRQMLEERKARNVVVIADTCHSGKVTRSIDSKAIGVVPALEAMQKSEQVPKGWVFIASADPDRMAYKDKAWNNGALTHVLLEGLNGKADGYKSAGAKDGVVTLGELRAYITDRMAEETLNVVGAKLLPLFYTTSGDTDIWKLTLLAQTR